MNFFKFTFNLVQGLKALYKIQLSLVGLGFKFILLGTLLLFKLGLGHLICIKLPAHCKILIFNKFTRLTVFGVILQPLRLFLANVKSLAKPEPFKGKGLRYISDHIPIKTLKKSKI